MPIPVPNLDDRRFQDLVDETKRMIPRFCPEWTNHNLSDPGVALIELFAWMSEMVLYRLNQVPDLYYTKFLELVGIEPFPPSVAHTWLTFWLSSVLDEPVVVPAGVPVSTTTPVNGEEVTFTTLEDLVVVPPVLTAALTARATDDERYVEVTEELRYEGGAFDCFTSTPLTPGDTFYLGFAESLAGNAVRLEVAASIEGIGVDPTNPPLMWEVWTGEAWVAARVHSDSTGGLNRNGEVVLMLPITQEPLTLGGIRAHWLRGRLLAVTARQPNYEASPRLEAVSAQTLGGTVRAEHASDMPSENLGRSNARSSQEFTVQHPPVVPRREGEHVRVITPQEAQDWEEVSDFTRSGPNDRHFTWDGGSGVIRFGPQVRYPDGTIRQHGAVPPDGAEIVVTGYRHGGGAVANVGPGTLTVLRTTVPFVDRVENLFPASGGVDAESVENAKLRGPLTLRTGQRAVTAQDYERLALEASTEVARARCLPPVAEGGPVRLLVVPAARRAAEHFELDDFALSDQLIERISEHLDERRIIGTSVEVGTPYYQGVTVAALLAAQPGRPVTLIRQRALDALYRYINPLAGGNEGSGWPFDANLNAAPLAQLLEAVEGVERVDEVLLFEFDLRTGRRHGPGREMVRLDRQSLFLSARHQVVVR